MGGWGLIGFQEGPSSSAWGQFEETRGPTCRQEGSPWADVCKTSGLRPPWKGL